MRWMTTQRLQDEFALPKVLAGEIIVEQWQAAVRYRWQSWAWLACCAVPVLARWFGWLPWSHGVHDHSAALWLMVIAGWGWIGVGRWLAEPAIRVAAAARARRLQRAGEAWGPYEPGASETASPRISSSGSGRRP